MLTRLRDLLTAYRFYTKVKYYTLTMGEEPIYLLQWHVEQRLIPAMRRWWPGRYPPEHYGREGYFCGRWPLALDGTINWEAYDAQIATEVTLLLIEGGWQGPLPIL